MIISGKITLRVLNITKKNVDNQPNFLYSEMRIKLNIEQSCRGILFMTVNEFWKKFIKDTSKDANLKYYESFRFELSETVSNQLLDLVLSGRKKATSSSLLAYQVAQEPLPQVGDFSIITDWDGVPRCVIETTSVSIIPFNEMTFEICKLEGEDDTLASWQYGHRKFFTNEGRTVGYEFTENMPVVFEEFEMVY